MRNHCRLVVETPNANLVAGMAWLQSTYTIRLNNQPKLVDHVLQSEERLLAFPWTRLSYYLAAPEHRPQWVRVDRLLARKIPRAPNTERRIRRCEPKWL
jgi:hypothetical protein